MSSAPASEEVFDPQSIVIPAIHSVEGYFKFVHTENLLKRQEGSLADLKRHIYN